ncbi:Uma2 family endonuclease [Streptomyces sp. NPDC007369]|uniref:Uma2 family endonuclease n=1 Tax=Streptomyces sp. NPDC007369 TaxID=3154589 RepID=UPI0033FF5423
MRQRKHTPLSGWIRRSAQQRGGDHGRPHPRADAPTARFRGATRGAGRGPGRSAKVPDLMVIAEEDADDTAKVVNSRDVLMVVEVVFRTNSLTDIRDKLHDYPEMGIPLYVVVDPRKDKRTVTVHSDPSRGPDGLRYRKEVPYAFGDTVTAGRWTLDTSSLKSYPADW